MKKQKPSALRLARITAGLPLREVAEGVGIHESTLSRYEHGLAVPAERLEAILQVIDGKANERTSNP